jgi:hypothetical protein
VEITKKRKPNSKSRPKSTSVPAARWQWLADAGGPVIPQDALKHVRENGVEIRGATWETAMMRGRTWFGTLYLHRPAPWDRATADTVRFEVLEMGEFVGWAITRARSDGEFEDFSSVELKCGWSETLEEALETMDIDFEHTPSFDPIDWVEAGRSLDGNCEPSQSAALREMEWRLNPPSAIASRAASRPSSAARAPQAAPRAPKRTLRT